MIEVARRKATADLIAQKVYRVDRDRKRELLSHLIKEHRWFQVLVFTRTKHGANKLAEQLGKDGIAALAIHGNKSQGARTRALAEFKDGSLQVLVATDIAARGLDIVDLPHVVNFELPNVPEDYVHRIGRTGRAGANGEAISLVCVDEDKYLADIEKLTKRPIKAEVIRGFEPDPRIKAEPILMGGQRGQRDHAGGGGGQRPAGTPRSQATRASRRPPARGAGARRAGATGAPQEHVARVERTRNPGEPRQWPRPPGFRRAQPGLRTRAPRACHNRDVPLRSSACSPSTR